MCVDVWVWLCVCSCVCSVGVGVGVVVAWFGYEANVVELVESKSIESIY